VPFREEDEEYFFGRTAVSEVVSNNIRSARVTLFYGPSGVGKSSLLRAALLPALVRRARRNIENFGDAEFCPVLFRDWSGNAARDLCNTVVNACARIGISIGEESSPIQQVKAAAAACWKADAPDGNAHVLKGEEPPLGTVLLILDQVEDFFEYHAADTWLADLIRDNRLPVRVLLSVREDSIASLDVLKTAEPCIFQNMLRLEHLDREGAEEAIMRPLKRFNELLAESERVAIEPGAAGELLDQMLERRADGKGFVQAAYLQLVLTRWWEADSGTGSLKLDTLLRKLGGPRKIVDRHFDETMASLPSAQRTTAMRVFGDMVTRSGGRISATFPAGETDAHAVLDRLTEARLVSPLPRPRESGAGEKAFEFSHDLVAKAALEWRRQFDLALVRRSARRFRIAALVFALLAISAIAAFFFALDQSKKAKAATGKLAQELGRTEVSRLIFSLATRQENTGLWELYLRPSDIRTAVLSRAITDDAAAELLVDSPERKIGIMDRTGYAALGLDSKSLQNFRSLISSACSGDLQSALSRIRACGTAMSLFDGDSEATVKFALGYWAIRQPLVLGPPDWIGAAWRSPDRASVRSVIEKEVSSAVERQKKDGILDDDALAAIAKLPWLGNEDQIQRITEACRPLARKGELLFCNLQSLGTQLDGAAMLKSFDHDVSNVQDVPSGLQGLNFHGADKFPRTWWVKPVLGEWVSLVMKAIDLNMPRDQTVFRAEGKEVMNWDLPLLAIKDAGRELLAHQPADATDPRDVVLVQWIKFLLDANSGPDVNRALRTLTSTNSWSSILPPRLVTGVAEGHLIAKDYVSMLPLFRHNRESLNDENPDMYTRLFGVFAEHYPSEALAFALEELGEVNDQTDFELVATALSKSVMKISPSVAGPAISRIRQAQPLDSVCGAFLPLVFRETVSDIMEIVKWPTCADLDRRALIAKVAQATGEDFAMTRYGIPVVNWRRFVEWAERNRYNARAKRPNFRSWKSETNN
jgi:hypothetical protein